MAFLAKLPPDKQVRVKAARDDEPFGDLAFRVRRPRYSPSFRMIRGNVSMVFAWAASRSKGLVEALASRRD